jgi:hypothetical protein
VACTIVMRWQLRFKSCFSESQILFLNPARHSPRSLRAFSRIDKSAYNPKPKNLHQGESNPFNVVHDDLANYRCNFGGAGGNLATKDDPCMNFVTLTRAEIFGDNTSVLRLKNSKIE